MEVDVEVTKDYSAERATAQETDESQFPPIKKVKTTADGELGRHILYLDKYTDVGEVKLTGHDN